MPAAHKDVIAMAKKLQSPEKMLARIGVELRHLDQRSGADRLRACHTIGCTLAKAYPGRLPYGLRVFEDVANLAGRGSSWAYKLRLFGQRYDQADLEEVCKFADRLHWGHVGMLVHILDKQLRARLQSQAAQHNWGVEELKDAIRRQTPKKHAGGRPPRGATDPHGCLRQLGKLTQGWLNYYQRLCRGEGSLLGKLVETPSHQINQELLNDLETCRQAVQAVGNASRGLSDSLRQLEQEIASKRKGKKRRSGT